MNVSSLVKRNLKNQDNDFEWSNCVKINSCVHNVVR